MNEKDIPNITEVFFKCHNSKGSLNKQPPPPSNSTKQICGPIGPAIYTILLHKHQFLTAPSNLHKRQHYKLNNHAP